MVTQVSRSSNNWFSTYISRIFGFHSRLKSEVREKELMDQVASLKSSVEKLSRGEYIHKEILFNNARDYGKRGLGSFPEPNQGTTPSPEIKTSFIKEVGSYCQHCQVTGHHTRECTLPSHHLPTLPKNYSSMFQNNHFLLSKVKGKVKAKFIGKIAKESKKSFPSNFGSQKLLSHMCKAQSLFGFLRLKSE